MANIYRYLHPLERINIFKYIIKMDGVGEFIKELDESLIKEIFASIKKLGTALNCQESAKKLLLSLNEGITFYQERHLPKKEVLLLLGDSNDPSRDLYAVGPGTFLNELLNISGEIPYFPTEGRGHFISRE